MSSKAQWDLSTLSGSPVQLCARCSEIFGRASNSETEIIETTNLWGVKTLTLHRNLPELIKGAFEHCWNCNHLCKKLQLNQRMSRMIHSDCLKVLPDKLPTMQTIMTIRPAPAFTQSDYSIHCEFVEKPRTLFIATTLHHLHSLKITNGYSISKFVNSLESAPSFEYIKSRLNHCKERHTLCQSSAIWYPKRLIVIHKERHTFRLRVVQTAEETLTGPYITLSHCWGQGQPLRLTSDNFAQFSRNIPTAEIPPLHKDAAVVALRLGVNYMWIDCLCIMQDSVDDWRRESATMGSVYKYGLLNIAAASAADSSGRLFGSRDPHVTLPDVLSMSNHGTNDQILWFNDEHILQLRYTTESIWQSPLFQRAWVFQETLLASRTIVFAQDQIHFRCAEEISSESLPTEHPLRKADIIGNAFGKEQRLITSMKYLSRDEIIAAWREVVRRYCNTSITRVSDRLVAISAIARCFGRLKESPYHAGLWEDTFINDMAWFTNDPRRRDDTYVAPSWSWASLCGRGPSMMVTECSLHKGNPLQIPKVLEVRTKASGKDEYGAIDNGWFKVCAPLYCMGRKREEELQWAFNQRYGELGIEWFHARICPDYHWNTDAGPPIIFALPLQLDSTSYRSDVSLLLLIAVTPAENVYRRVGFCLLKVVYTLSIPGPHQSVSKALETFLRRMERGDEDILSHERMDNGWHTITII